MSILGSHVARREDLPLLRGAGTYVDNLELEGAVHVVFVRSIMAHARVVSVDVDEARAAPGVVAVLTAADLAGLGKAPNCSASLRLMMPAPFSTRSCSMARCTVASPRGSRGAARSGHLRRRRQPVDVDFMDYPVVSAVELPSFELAHVEIPTRVNELGAKGVGDSGTIGSIPAVYNAVVDAVSHLGA